MESRPCWDSYLESRPEEYEFDKALIIYSSELGPYPKRVDFIKKIDDKSIELTLKNVKINGKKIKLDVRGGLPGHPSNEEILKDITVKINLKKTLTPKYREELENHFSIIFCALRKKQVSGVSSHIRKLPELVMIDSYGNRYDIYPLRVNDERGNEKSLDYQTYIGSKDDLLPDSFLDFLFNDATKNATSYIEMTKSDERDFTGRQIIYSVSYDILNTRNDPKIWSHRKFEPTAELAKYISHLEAFAESMEGEYEEYLKMEHSLKNEGVQTNAKNKNTNSKWNSLFKEMTSAKTKKNQDRLKNELTDFYREKMKKYI